MESYSLIHKAERGHYIISDDYGRQLKLPATVVRNGVRTGAIHIKGYHLSGDRLLRESGYRFHLMNRNTLIADISVDKVHKVYDTLPYGFDNISSWFSQRAMLACVLRPQEFFSTIGIRDYIDLINVTHCVSLHDNFWIKSPDSTLAWKDVSPFRRSYSERVSRYALEGIDTEVCEEDYFSPVIGNEGSFPHTWCKLDSGKLVFVKAGSRYTLPAINSGHEPYSEYFASQISGYLGFRHVVYRLRDYKRLDNNIDIVTECACYTSESVGSVSAQSLGLSSYEQVIEFCRGIGADCFHDILNMLFQDCLLLNTDRHFRNIEFFINNKTREILGLVPIFDNNYSLCPRHIPGEPFNRSEYIARDNRSFEDLYKLVTSHKSYARELSMLRDFRFKPPKIEIQSDRLEFLNWLLREQVSYLLSI